MQAIRELKESNLAGGGRRALYALPWYVVIGPPGAGKTTAIGRSGLNFPLRRAQSGLQGIGGTRNCEWWLANEAVLIDTAGRYTTASEDREEWLEFLSLLRTHRRKKPINGVLVAIGVDEVYQRDEESLLRHSRRVRARVEEIQRHLGIIVPVYLIFTKCDLIPGFSEMYAELDRTAREQPFGFKFSGLDGDLRELEEHLSGLVASLSRAALLRLLETPNPVSRDQIHRYGRDFCDFLATIKSFVQTTFASTVYEEAPRLRGVYFTSALQEGSPIDRAGDALARAFGVSPPRRAVSGPQRVYFLAKVFPLRIFPEAGLTIKSPQKQRRRRKVVMTMLSALCGLGCLSALLNIVAVQAANRRIREVERRVGESMVYLSQGRRQPHRSLQAAARADEGTKAQMSLMRVYGVDPRETLERAIRASTAAFIQTTCVDPIVQSIRAQLQAGEVTRIRLAQYLLLTSPAQDPLARRRWLAWFPWLVGSLQERLPSECSRVELSNHLRNLNGQVAEREAELVEDARSLLFRQEKQGKLHSGDLCPDCEAYRIDLATIFRDDTTFVSRDEAYVPGQYTAKGYRTVRKQLEDSHQRTPLEADWVATTPKSTQEWKKHNRDIMGNYVDNYIKSWDLFLESIEVRIPEDTGISELLQGFERIPGPVERLIAVIRKNTDLRGNFTQQGFVASLAHEGDVKRISGAFSELLDLVESGEGDSTVGRHRQLVSQTRDLLDGLATSPEMADEVSEQLVEIVRDVERLLLRQPVGRRKWAARILLAPLRYVQSRAGKTKGTWLQQRWCQDVQVAFIRDIHGRYPFDSSSTSEVLPKAFTKTYGPEGVIWGFYAESLSELIVPSRGRYQRIRGKGTRVLQPSASKFFMETRLVTDTWFSAGGDVPTIDLEIRFHPTPEVAAITLRIGDHEIEYHNGEEAWQPLSYTPNRANAELTIRGQLVEQKLYGRGEWGFLRLLDQGRVIDSENDDVVVVEFPVHGVKGRSPRVSIRVLGEAGRVARLLRLGTKRQGLRGFFPTNAQRIPSVLTRGGERCSERSE